MRHSTILPPRSVTADMIARIEKPAYQPLPYIPTEEESANFYSGVGEYDQLQQRLVKKKIMKSMKDSGYTWNEKLQRWVA